MAEQKQLVDILQTAITEALSNLHTATIARVTSVNEITINCRPVINRVVRGQSISLPEFVDVPPLFLQGGDSYTAHPITKGDYCLLIITERCFDRWYDGQDGQSPAEFRMHDYSDAFAVVGINPKSKAITIPSVIERIGDALEKGDIEQEGNRVHTGNYSLTGDMDITGGLNVSENSNVDGDHSVGGNTDSSTYSVGGTAGATGVFVCQDGTSVTVNEGIITEIA